MALTIRKCPYCGRLIIGGGDGTYSVGNGGGCGGGDCGGGRPRGPRV